MKLRFYFDRFCAMLGLVPSVDSYTDSEIEYEYVSYSLQTHKVRVYISDRFLFSFYHKSGMEAKPGTRLADWYLGWIHSYEY